MKIKLDAMDTLFFRDGKPFSWGDETWADGMFPPSPSVIYGALRSRYFSEHIDQLRYADEPDDPTKNLKISAVALQTGNRLLFPMPLDCVKQKGVNEDSVTPLKDMAASGVSNCRLGKVLISEKNASVETVENAFLMSSSLKKYLRGQPGKLSYADLSKRVVTEPKIGIGRENQTHTTKEGMLYRIEMKRLESVMGFGKETESLALFAAFEGLSIDDTGFLKLGGEGKSVHYAPSAVRDIEAPQLKGNRFKLYLASPALFEKGWLPSFIDEDTLTGQCGNLEIRLETAMIGKPYPIGGFRMKPPVSPKPMRMAVPAGSVYYFEIMKGEIQDAVDLFHNHNISDDESHQGFGLTFVGGV